MKHVMVDLETLGTVPGCVILSIGAVEFDVNRGTLGSEFYTVISTESCKDHYLSVSEDTMAWWQRQSAEARSVVDLAETAATTLPEALNSFNAYLAKLGTPKEVLIYGNGADFDNSLLNVAYDVAQIKPAYAPYNGRCYRTLKNMHELFGDRARAPEILRSGLHHNALDDAKTQARHLIMIVRQAIGEKDD